MTEAIIRCENLWHTYATNNVVAVREINLEIHPKEIIGVIGQNGSGKTTLVKHFNGLLKPTQGKVFVKGKDTGPMHVQELAADVGYVYQNPNHQLFARTVEAELEFGPRNLGLSQEEIEERREQAIEFFKLQPYRDQHPYRIGFPLRKLVGMASVYTMRPAVFILDEPTTGQDNITTRTVYKLIERLCDEGATVLCVAHDMILLAEVVERMLVLRDSELIADATPREVFSNYELMHSTHLTPPQITELSVRLRHEKDDLKEVKLSVDEMTEYTLQTVKENQGGA
ncbi:MAG: energy-coupling factor ABC transporter ATP-binding protein [Anaerolineales bacterium]|jgi:energy-coupling factor transport system ATP-binding protein